MSHFKNALKLRKLGNFKEAGEELKQCDDPEGLLYLGFSYMFGGFGIETNTQKAYEILKFHPYPWAAIFLASSNMCNNFTPEEMHLMFSIRNHEFCLELHKQGNTFGTFFINSSFSFHPSEEYIQLILDSAKNNDAAMQYVYGLFQGSTKWLELATGQKFKRAYCPLARCIEQNDLIRATKLCISANFPCDDRVNATIETRLQSLFLYGEYFTSNRDDGSIRMDLALTVYNLSSVKARDTTLRWMLISKPLRVSKDIAKLIGRMVYNSRYTPHVWISEEKQDYFMKLYSSFSK